MTSPSGTVTLKVAVKDTETASRSLSGLRDDIRGIAPAAERSAKDTGDAFARLDRQMGGAFDRMDRTMSGSMDRMDRTMRTGTAGWGQATDRAMTDLNSSVRSGGTRVEATLERAMQQAGQAGNRALGQAGHDGGRAYSDGVGSSASRGADGAAGGFLGKFKVAGLAGAAVVGAAIGVVVADAFSEAAGRRTSEAKAVASLGLLPDEAKGLGKVAGQLYANGYGESMGELTDQVATVKGTLKGLNDTDLTKLTGQAISFSQAFDTDVTESVSAAQRLITSGLATDAEAAFDLLTKGSQRVPAALRGDLMDATNEYSGYFNQLGMSGEKAFALLVDGSAKGMYGIDKTGDAIGEFTKLVGGGDTGALGALTELGLNAGEMSSAVAAGGDRARDASAKIVTALQGIKDPGAQAAKAIALFGTPLEDLGTDYVPTFLKGMSGASDAMAGFAGSAGVMDSAMGSTTTKVELFWRGLKTNLVDFISDKVLPKLVEFADWAGEKLGPAMQIAGEWIETKLVPALSAAWQWISEKLGPVVQDLADYITGDLIPAWGRFVDWWSTTGWPALEPILTFIKNSIENIVTVVRGVIDVLGGVLSGDWSRAWDGLKQIFSGFWDQIINVASSAWAFIEGVITGILPWIGQKLSEFGGFLQAKGGELIGWIGQGISAGAQGIWDWFAGLADQAWGWLSARWDAFQNFGSQIVGWLVGGLVAAVIGIASWFGGLADQAWNWVGEKWETFTGIGGQVISWLVEGVTGGVSALYDWVTGGMDTEGSLLNGLSKALDGIKDFIGGLGGRVIGWIAGGITAAAGEVWKALTSVFSRDENETPAQQAARTNGVSGLAGGGMPFSEPNGGNGASTQWTSGGGGSFGAGGGVAEAGRVLAGYEPGVDRVNAVLAPGEAVMVPEWTRMVGVENVYRMNRAARSGRYVAPNSFLGKELFAGGGIAGLQTGAEAFGGQISARLADGIRARKTPSEAAALTFGPGRGGFLDGVFGIGQSLVDQIRSSGGASAAGAVVMNGNIVVDGVTAGLPAGARGEFLKAVASKMGTSYVWGAAGPDVFDCSGLMSWALGQAGVGKGRLTASGFHHTFPKVSMPGKPGDLVTFDTGRIPGDAGHIGAILDPARFLMMHTDGAGPARVGDYKNRSGGPLSIVDPIGGAVTPSAATQNAGRAGDPAAGKSNSIGSLLSQIAGGVASRFGLGMAGSAGGAAPAPVQGGRWDPNVERWRPTVLQALALAGQPGNLADTVLNQIRSESSGNPRAINLYDSNARKGTPSKGLIQTIDPTFQSYRLPSLANDPYDPLANIVAGIRYAVDRYGSLTAGMRGVAYENGGGLPPGFTLAYNGTRQTETVVRKRPDQMWDDVVGLARNANGQGGGTVIEAGAFAPGAIQINGADLTAEEIEDLMVNTMVRTLRDDQRRALRR